MNKLFCLLAYAFLMLAALGCSPDPAKKPAYSKLHQLQAYITSPAGTNARFTYDAGKGKIVAHYTTPKDSLLQFLPYPGNYGFIPGTMADTARGGDGQPLDILVLAQATEASKTQEVIPVAVVHIAKPTGTDFCVIAVPSRPSERIIDVTTYAGLAKKFPAVKQILNLWFMHHDGQNQNRIMSWKDEKAADAEVRKWLR